MAYRRRQGITRASTFKEEIHHPSHDFHQPSAAQYQRDSSHIRSKSFAGENVAFKGDSKSGFWGVLARKAKAILEEDDIAIEDEISRFQPINTSTRTQEPCQSTDYNSKKTDNPAIHKGLDANTTSLNQLGDTLETTFEEGHSMVETKTADMVQETCKLQISKKGNNCERLYPAVNNPWQQPNMQSPEPQMKTHQEAQLKASRKVAMATATQNKLLQRELKTTKADLTFAKERCAQLEEENKFLRENREKGDHRADDDLIRVQLETLLAEKARLAHENSIYARENRFLREIVEYHQLTMHDVVYLDEGMEEATEVMYPISASPNITKMISNSVSTTSPAAAIDEHLPKDTDGQPTVSEEQEQGTIKAP